jgi:hypothetical protein
MFTEVSYEEIFLLGLAGQELGTLMVPKTFKLNFTIFPSVLNPVRINR